MFDTRTWFKILLHSLLAPDNAVITAIYFDSRYENANIRKFHCSCTVRHTAIKSITPHLNINLVGKTEHNFFQNHSLLSVGTVIKGVPRNWFEGLRLRGSKGWKWNGRMPKYLRCPTAAAASPRLRRVESHVFYLRTIFGDDSDRPMTQQRSFWGLPTTLSFQKWLSWKKGTR